MDGGGNFVVVWDSQAQDGAGGGVYAQRFDNSGTAVGAEFHVNSYTTGDQLTPIVATDTGGAFVVAWRGAGPTDANAVFARRFDSAGVPQGTEFQVSSTGNPAYPELAMDKTGRVRRRVGGLHRRRRLVKDTIGAPLRRDGNGARPRVPGQHLHRRQPVLSVDRHGHGRQLHASPGRARRTARAPASSASASIAAATSWEPSSRSTPTRPARSFCRASRPRRTATSSSSGTASARTARATASSAARRRSPRPAPSRWTSHPPSSGTSNKNGVLEPGETVVVETAWSQSAARPD